MCEIASYVNSPEESKRLNMQTLPMLIISASGMATGGRVIHHIKAFAGNSKNTLLFAGYQATGTRGARIVSGGESVRIHGQNIPIRAEVRSIDNLSAHADQNELITWASKFSNRPIKTFITHGEHESANGLKSALESKLHWNVEIPKYLDEVEL